MDNAVCNALASGMTPMQIIAALIDGGDTIAQATDYYTQAASQCGVWI